jgi:hypothetical protein
MPVPDAGCRFPASSPVRLYCCDRLLGSARVGRAAEEARVCAARRAAAEAAEPLARVCAAAGLATRVARFGALGRT